MFKSNFWLPSSLPSRLPSLLEELMAGHIGPHKVVVRSPRNRSVLMGQMLKFTQTVRSSDQKSPVRKKKKKSNDNKKYIQNKKFKQWPKLWQFSPNTSKICRRHSCFPSARPQGPVHPGWSWWSQDLGDRFNFGSGWKILIYWKVDIYIIYIYI